ncbi:MAG: hypothetical protein AAFR83_24715, partial [Cyanobacteria bacterium J06629_18]
MSKPIQLTTRETKHLLDEYPEIEFLEAGHVGEWLLTRKDQLLILAKEERIGSSLSKTVGIATATASIIFHATSPLAPIGLLLGAAGYAIAQIQDSTSTHTLNPIPFIRGGVLEVFGSLGHSTARKEFT